MSKSIFQRVLDGELPLPKAAETLGAKIVEYDAKAGTIVITFTATDAFTNPAGHIQGGFLAAMLDDTMGPALMSTLSDGEIAPTLELKVSFIKPARVGQLTGYGRVLSRGGSVCFLEGELKQQDALIAKASATAIIRKMDS